ncbi:MAG TPA: SRPBCC domain-containing protein [Polyangiaceae bacterium]|nr:SRPBCC domain-containing protein [Polyangiaceae bacterium]
MSAPAGDAAKASVYVAVAPADAFDVFTREIDRWWKTGPAYRVGGRRAGRLVFEPKPGGRLFETFEAPAGARTIEVGRVTAWDPPWRVELEWRNANFAPGEATFVEVLFVPSGEGTMVSVRHSGWAALREGHPARHGLVGPAFSRMIGLWWGSLLTALREHVEGGR